MNKTPIPLLWIFESYSLSHRKYLEELDFIKKNTAVTHVAISVRNGVRLQNIKQCHDAIEELTRHAHELGLKVVLHLVTAEGFYNSPLRSENLPEVDLGKENAGRSLFVLVAQYYNFTAVTEDWEKLKSLMDAYSDIPLDGVVMDEYGYLVLNSAAITSGKEPPFRGRMYDRKMAEYYKTRLGTDLERLLFDMRYAPKGEPGIRIKAINTYFETLRVFPLDVEKKVYDYAKKLFGADSYVSCHNTFHNSLESDEIWHTACNWWDIPRDMGHTDENICFPVRFGIMLACRNPITMDMYYSKKPETHYDHIVEGARFGCREFHHAFDDFFWGADFNDLTFLKNIKRLDSSVACLDEFQTVYPKMDLLVVYGAAAQNNWYPNEAARSVWDIDGTLHVQGKCAALWRDGYRLALAPDYAIEDGRITLSGGKVCFGGYEFSHLLFLYPKYAKSSTYAFLNACHKSGVRMAVVGPAGVDFEGNAATLTSPHYEEYTLDILEDMGCERSALENGCVYEDGSFVLVTKELLDGGSVPFSFALDGKEYAGSHTGLLAYREGGLSLATRGSRLSVNGAPVALREIGDK